MRTNEIGQTMWVKRNLIAIGHAFGDQKVLFCDGLLSALQPTNLALEWGHSTLEFNQDSKNLA